MYYMHIHNNDFFVMKCYEDRLDIKIMKVIVHKKITIYYNTTLESVT